MCVDHLLLTRLGLASRALRRRLSSLLGHVRDARLDDHPSSPPVSARGKGKGKGREAGRGAGLEDSGISGVSWENPRLMDSGRGEGEHLSLPFNLPLSSLLRLRRLNVASLCSMSVDTRPDLPRAVHQEAQEIREEGRMLQAAAARRPHPEPHASSLHSARPNVAEALGEWSARSLGVRRRRGSSLADDSARRGRRDSALACRSFDFMSEWRK